MARGLSTKRIQIDKANATMVAIIVVSSFVTIFSLVAFRALWGQRGYQAKVISKKEEARDQLKKNIAASKTLVASYQSFVGTTQNVLDGDPNGKGEKDGDNAKIILDALPSKYDFPALATSIEKLLGQNGLQILKIEGTDDEVAQEQNNATNKNPQPVAMTFNISVQGNYANTQSLVNLFEHSIRPFEVITLTLKGSDASLVLDATAQTFYQPAKTLKIDTEVVR